MEYYYLNEYNPNTKYLLKATSVLEDGGIICYPSETNYGVACLLSSPKGVKKLNTLAEKFHRGKNQTLMCKDFNQVSTYAYIPNDAFRIMKKALPGPYTFILEANSSVPKVFQTKRNTVGFRISNYTIIQELLKLLESPLISFSVFPSKEDIEYVSVGDIEKTYNGELDLFLDVGEIFISKTTVVDFSSEQATLIRVGDGEVFFNL